MASSSSRPAGGDHRLWEIAVLFHLRDAFRSGDVWLAGSRRYGDLKQLLVPPQADSGTARLAVPLRPGNGWQSGKARLDITVEASLAAPRAPARSPAGRSRTASCISTS
jgi:hypothetical protein